MSQEKSAFFWLYAYVIVLAMLAEDNEKMVIGRRARFPGTTTCLLSIGALFSLRMLASLL